jgi:polysaccharide biosynthesis protein PslH
VRIIVVAPRVPWPVQTGGDTRTFSLVRSLARSAEVSLVALSDSLSELPADCPLEDFCERVMVVRRPGGRTGRRLRVALGLLRPGHPMTASLFAPPALGRALRAQLAAAPWDIVQLEGSYTAGNVPALQGLPGLPPVVLSTQNVEAQRLARMASVERQPGKRLGLAVEARRLARWEPAAIRSCQGVLAVSASDAETFTSWAPDVPVHLAPNGVDLERFWPGPEEARDPALLAYVGAMDYLPNADGVRWFCREVLPAIRDRVPEARLDVVGRGATALSDLARLPGVRLRGFVEDIREVYATAGSLVVPLRAGGGTRLKILEALACACPVVSTRIGAEGIPLCHERDVLFADSAGELADQSLRLMQDRKLAVRVGVHGRVLVERDFGWHAIADGVLAFYERLAHPPNGTGP